MGSARCVLCAEARIRENFALVHFSVLRLKYGSARFVGFKAFWIDGVVLLAAAFTGQVKRFKVLEILTTIFTGGDQLKRVSTRCASYRYANGSSGSVDGLLCNADQTA